MSAAAAESQTKLEAPNSNSESSQAEHSGQHGYRQHHNRHRHASSPVPENMAPRLEMNNESCGPTSDEYKKYRMNPSRKLPGWIWYIVAKSLGIKTHENDKPWFGTLMYVLTLTTGFGYAVTNTWYTFYDIVSKMTEQTIFTGTTQILTGIFWVGLGIYANVLAGDLFGYPRFRETIRVHSKTIFGVSAAKIITVFAIGALAINSYENSSHLFDQHCRDVNINVLLCKFMYVTRVSFAVLAVFWNVLVATIMMSICRTHTVGLRRFITELEKDGQLFEMAWIRRRTKEILSADIVTLPDGFMTAEGEFMWDDEIPSFPSNFGNAEDDLPNVVDIPRLSASSVLFSTSLGSNYGSLDQRPSINDGVFTEREDLHENLNVTEQTVFQRNFSYTSQRTDGETSIADSTLPGQCQREAGMLSLDQILISYWKTMAHLRVSSLALQRWLFSTLLFLLLISATYIIKWLKHPVDPLEVVEFVIAIMLLPLLCSAYAEVNYECSRVLTVICPINERLPLLRYFTVQPLVMTMYGFAVTYGSIGTAIAAVGIAFATKIVLDEFSRPPTVP